MVNLIPYKVFAQIGVIDIDNVVLKENELFVKVHKKELLIFC